METNRKTFAELKSGETFYINGLPNEYMKVDETENFMHYNCMEVESGMLSYLADRAIVKVGDKNE